MSVYTLLEVWSVAAVLALLAILVILKPMFAVLVEVCGGADRARFWSAYACVFTVVTPLMAVSTPGLLDAAAAQVSLAPVLQRAVFFALAGIAVALLVAGQAIWKPIARALRAPLAVEDAAKGSAS